MTAKRSGATTTSKACERCSEVFARPRGYSDRKWLKQELCDLCERVALADRIAARVVADGNGCLLWRGSTKNGYGQISVHRKPTYVHRLVWELKRGPIPDGLEVCHSCDVRRCCNDEHFFLGSQAENLADMRRKGRHHNPPLLIGEANHNATLSDDEVASLRAMRRSGSTQREIAKHFGVSQSTVWGIVHRIYRNPRRPSKEGSV